MSRRTMPGAGDLRLWLLAIPDNWTRMQVGQFLASSFNLPRWNIPMLAGYAKLET
jgi:hypothetical protein